MATQLNNYTASGVTFNETAGVNVSILHPSATIVLTPDPGYTLTASSFSAITPLPSNISGLTFQQSGTNVNAIATFTNPFTMPQSNVSIPLCINGQAVLKMYSISGSITNNICNISGSLPTSYSGSGNFNTTATLLTIPVNAIDGYYFPTQPTLTVTTGNNNSYTITSSNSFDGDGNLIGVQFNLNYKFPDANVSGNIITLNACAYEIYVPSIEITNYSINTATIIEAGETRVMQVFGNEGAVFTVSMNGTNLVTNVVMGATGVYSFPIVFPAVTANTTYTITLSGDLASPFLPQNPFTIQQRVATLVTLDVLFNSGIAAVTPVVKSFTAFGSPIPGEDAFIINFPWSITPSPALTGNKKLVLSAQPTDANWSNLNPLTNGGTSIFPVASISLENPAVSGTITVTGNVETYGGSSMTTTLDLTSLLRIIDSPTISTTVISNITGTSASSGGNAISDNGSSITVKGVQWSATSNFATILGSTSNGTGTANYSSSITGLTQNTTYYVRAYATNAAGTGYGNVVSFTTLNPLPYSYTLQYNYFDDTYVGFANSAAACAATTTYTTVWSSSATIEAGMALYTDQYGQVPLAAYSFGTANSYFKLGDNNVRFEQNYPENELGNVVYSVASCSTSSVVFSSWSSQSYTTIDQDTSGTVTITGDPVAFFARATVIGDSTVCAVNINVNGNTKSASRGTPGTNDSTYTPVIQPGTYTYSVSIDTTNAAVAGGIFWISA